MKIELLTNEHSESIKGLFISRNFMGVPEIQHRTDTVVEFQKMAYEVFGDTFLSGLNTYKAFGSIEDGKVSSCIAFHEYSDSPEWYGTHMRCNSRNKVLPSVLDAVMDYNEQNGRLKFFSLFNSRYTNIMRRFAFSKKNAERYDSFDEYIVPPKMRAFYNTHWQILYTRKLLPVETLVRCTFLKQKYRTNLPIAGNL